MNHTHSSTSTDQTRKFPVSTLLIAVAILAGAAAILVFNVPVFTVLTFGFLGLMLFGCSFMHAGHEHGGGADPQNSGHIHSTSNESSTQEHLHADGPATQGDPQAKNKDDADAHQGNSHSGHSGCC